MNLIKKVIGILIMLVGVGIFLYPYMADALLDYRTEKIIREFDDTYGMASKSESDESETDLSDLKTDILENGSDLSAAEMAELYRQCLAYNQQIYQERQAGLCDAWSYEQASIDIEESRLDAFGYIEIPAMDLVLPLYLGASTENMAKGATILGQTSLPIGGENTNAVIAAHRGYRGAAYFREIEKLSIGDVIYVTNPWAKLTYIVTAIDIILPNDIDAIKIQEGKDLITLLTCHPYRSHGKYRYVVYCERIDGETEDEGNETGILSEYIENDFEDADSDVSGNTITASDGNVYVLSGRDIEFEQIFRIICAGAMVVVVLFFILKGKNSYADTACRG